MDQPQREDGLTDSVDRERRGRLVASQHTPTTASQTLDASRLASLPAPLAVPIRPKRTLFFIVGAVALIFLVGAVLAALFLRTLPSPIGSHAPTNQTPPSGPVVRSDLVEIPGGTFEMGRNDGGQGERPPHTITVQTFYMDRMEVTNQEYAQFIREEPYEAPTNWSNSLPPPLQEKWPVANVSSADAKAFAKWRSKRDGVIYRLPTEEEWEYAARSGGLYKMYPWGDHWEEGRAVVNEANSKPVGSYPAGANRWGVLDLIGNVWEWTSSEASYYPGNATHIPSEMKDWRVVRGFGYRTDPGNPVRTVSATYRDWFAPNMKHPTIGFRLVRSVH